MEINKLMQMVAFLVLSFCLCKQGSAQNCKLSDIAVTQTGKPSTADGYTSYAVTVENRCVCTQSNVKLSCPGFSSSMGVNPDVLSVDGNGKLFTLNGGSSIGMGPSYAVKFSYSSKSQISFTPVSSTIAESPAHELSSGGCYCWW